MLWFSDVGAVPYYSNLRTLDFTPKSLTDLNLAEHGWSVSYVLQKQPEVVVFVSFSLTQPQFYDQHLELLNAPGFQDQYGLVGIMRSDWYQDRCYWVYVSNKITLNTEELASFPKGIGYP